MKLSSKVFLVTLVQLLLVSQISARVLNCLSSCCTSKAPYTTYYATAADISAGNSQQCAAGVKKLCPTSPALATGSWKKGIKVLDNCRAISAYTAIATFDSNGRYYGHAAVFLSCDSVAKTIQVWDQWSGHPFQPRTLRDLNGTPSNNPNSFYVVEV